MSATDDYARLAISAVLVSETRQRSDLALDEDFVASIRMRGVLSPLLVKRDGTLVAGGRRLAASRALGLPDVPVRYVADHLAPTELRTIELEENIRRCSLPWRDEVRAVSELHTLWTSTRESWSQARSEEQIGCDMTRYLRVSRELDNPRLEAATSLSSAYNICQRIDARHADAMLEDIMFAADERETHHAQTDEGETESGPVTDVRSASGPAGEGA